MGLLDLPPELLDEVVTLTILDGFESFVITCKAVHVRAAPQIKRYNAIQRLQRYAAAPVSVVGAGKPLRLLYEISRDPLVAQSIKALNLGDTRGRSCGNVDVSDFEEFRYDEEVMEKIKKLVTEAEYLQRAGVDVDIWWKKVIKEDESQEQDEEQGEPYTIVSLLSQLPNLTSLQLSPFWSDVRPFDDANEDNKRITYVLDALIQNSNSGERRGKPLGKLETILPFMPEGYEERAGLQCVQPFMLLNTLTELYAVSCIAVDDNYTGIPFQWRYPTVNSSLRRIELAFCCIDAEGISALVSRTPLLQVFKYSHQTKWHGCQHDWNPGAFNEAVARHCGQNITDLAITIDDLYGDVINGASSFLSYPNLRYLEVDVRIFNGPPIESGQQHGINSVLPEGAMPWKEDDIPCIGSMLPISVVEVQINTDYPYPDKRALIALLKNLKQQRAERLTSLDKVTIRQFDGESATDVVEKTGATLVIFDKEGKSGTRSMMPAWKREFEKRVGGL